MLRFAPGGDRTRRRAAAGLLACWCAVGLTYGGALAVPFVWDDHHLVGEHSPVVRAESAGDALVAALTSPFWELRDREFAPSYYRPLTVFSLAVDFRLADGDPWVFHLTNLLLHLGVCGLVFALCRRLGAPVLAATLGAALFGTVPRLTHTVTWISGRTDVIAALGALAAVALWCRTAPSTSDLRWRVAAATALLCGLLGKEVAVAGAVALVAWEWAHSPGGLRGAAQAARRLLPVAAVLALYAAGRSYAGIAGFVSAPPPWPQRGWSVLEALGYYAQMVATPWDAQLIIGTLGLTHPLRMVAGAVAGAALVGCIAGLATRRFAPERSVHLALAIAALLPVVQILPLPHDVIVSDHYLYLPLAALTPLALAAASRWVAVRPPLARLAAGAAAALVLFFAAGTWQRNLLWQDELALWRETARRAGPANGWAEVEIGSLLGQRGHNEEAVEHYRRGIALMQERIAIEPSFRISPLILFNYGLTLSALGRAEEAIPVLERLVAQRPDVPVYRIHLAAALSRGLHFERADREFAAALALYPGYEFAARMRRQNRRAAELARGLPPAAPDESVELRAKRAFVYFQVGRLGEANALWLDVVRSPDATPELLAAARTGLFQQNQVVGETDGSRALAAALAARGVPGPYRPKSSRESPK